MTPIALTIWQWCPEPVDPDMEEARSRVMRIWSDGTPDREQVIGLVALAIKHGLALERGEG